MRINKFIALATGMSRRSADLAVQKGRVRVNDKPPEPGLDVGDEDTVTLDGQIIKTEQLKTVIYHKPVGLIVSRDGQGGKTIYDLLPAEIRHLKPVGRLDKDSSGLLLLTNDGELAHELTHPSHQKTKIYEIELLKPLQPIHQQMINSKGVELDDGLSKLQLESLDDSRIRWQITMREGRNRQIRRTFEALGYTVQTLHRTVFGPYRLERLAPGSWQSVN